MKWAFGITQPWNIFLRRRFHRPGYDGLWDWLWPLGSYMINCSSLSMLWTFLEHLDRGPFPTVTTCACFTVKPSHLLQTRETKPAPTESRKGNILKRLARGRKPLTEQTTNISWLTEAGPRNARAVLKVQGLGSKTVPKMISKLGKGRNLFPKYSSGVHDLAVPITIRVWAGIWYSINLWTLTMFLAETAGGFHLAALISQSFALVSSWQVSPGADWFRWIEDCLERKQHVFYKSI